MKKLNFIKSRGKKMIEKKNDRKKKKKKNPGKFQAFFISNKTCKIVNN